MDASRRQKHRLRVSTKSIAGRTPWIHAGQAVHTARVNASKPENNLGHVIGNRKMESAPDWRICGISGPVSALYSRRNGARGKDAGECGLGKGGSMDDGKLEANSTPGGTIDYLDLRQLRQIIERIEGTTKRTTASRWACAFIAIWAIGATAYAVTSSYTIESLQVQVQELKNK